MSRVPVTLACGPYDRMEALRSGIVQPEGIDLTYVPIQSPPELFARMIKRGSFDVAEMSMSLYTQLRSKGEFPFVGIPVFPSRLFRHGYIFVNSESGITAPEDLSGRRVGVQEYHQTAGVWVRGLLASEYGVDLSSIRWKEGGVNAPRTPDVLDLRPGTDIDIEFIGEDVSLDQLLESGQIDAYFGARKPDSYRTSDRVQRLFPDYQQAERDYFRRTGIFPMMHTVVVREDLVDRHPWILESMFKAFVESKQWAMQQMRFSGTHRYMVPWLQAHIEEIDEIFGGDPWPYGLEENRVAIETFLGYLVDQGFLATAPPIEQLFTPLETRNE